LRDAQADRLELLAQLKDHAAELFFGHSSLRDRLEEMRGGYPSGGSGGGALPWANPTDDAHGRRDPAVEVERRYDAQLHRVRKELGKLLQIHREHANPKRGVDFLSDPGCQLCAELSPTGDLKVDQKRPTAREPVWYATYGHIEVEEKRTSKKRRIAVCYWDWRFWHKQGRVSTRQERLDHHEGRRVRVSA